LSTGHVTDELSAYIDGEAKDPARIARHLQFCERCARRHMELLKLSAHVQALPGPETRPDFLTRVMARVAEHEAVPPRWRLRFTVPQLAMVLLLAMGVGLAYYGRHSAHVPREPRYVANWSDDEVVAKFEQLLNAGADLGLFEDESAYEDEEVGVSVDDVLDLLASTAWTDNGDEGLYAEEDLFGAMDALEQEDSPVLRALLTEYMNEG